jgi:urea ABC transporter ATP-binding protein UrtE
MLRLEDVHGGYRRSPVLQGVTLELDDGEIAGLLGRNGVGKTTTLRAIVGHVQTTSGTISLGDVDITRMPSHERARLGIAYVPQGREIFSRLTVLENLRVAAHASRRPDWRQDVEEVFEEFPILASRRDQRGGSLSGGQQQILALGRALITGPRLVILDEPSEGVQPSIVDEIAEIVRGLSQKRGLTVLLVEQNLDFATRLASRAYLMDKGRVVRTVDSRELLENRDLQHEYMGV